MGVKVLEHNANLRSVNCSIVGHGPQIHFVCLSYGANTGVHETLVSISKLAPGTNTTLVLGGVEMDSLRSQAWLCCPWSCGEIGIGRALSVASCILVLQEGLDVAAILVEYALATPDLRPTSK